MMKNSVPELYFKQYVEFGFERAGLFKLIHETYRCREVLYPGSSVHITPSFYFPHVAYVDKSSEAAVFFQDHADLKIFVDRHKVYKQPAYFKFIHQDYERSLPLRENQYDLLLSLFSDKVTQSCLRYLKPGGLLLTNNFHGAATSSANGASSTIDAAVKFQKGRYRLVEFSDSDSADHPRSSERRDYARQTSQGLKYVENETYYMFKKVRR